MNAPVNRFTAARANGSNGGHLTVSVARTLNDLMHVMAVRTLVYMGEQSCPYDEEYDGNDFCGATHLILRCDGEPVGVVRLRWFSDFVKLERLAIRAEYRGGPGLLMLAREAVALAERKGYRRLMGHVQRRVIPFWRRYFKARAREDRQPFYFSDYDYIEMEFDLHPPPDAISIDSDPMVILRPEGEWDRPGVLDLSTMRAAAA
ncbi:MAG: GNAT family N-acetyltransferase [Parcubacteria group bacterium]